MSDGVIRRLIQAEGKVRVLEMDDGSIVERSEGSVSWRNNNPGNLKFEYSGGADQTVKTTRTKDKALADAQRRYEGVVDLDQWGNAVFESYEAGRAAKIHLLRRNHSDRTVEEMLESYSKADYSGAVNHRAQADFIYGEGSRQGIELRDKTIEVMTDAEIAALADGIKGFEGWRVGEILVMRAGYDVAQRESQLANSPYSNVLNEGAYSPTVGELQTHLRNLGYTDSQDRPLTVDHHFGRNTRHAVEAFQRDHGLEVDGKAGPNTWVALREATRAPSIHPSVASNAAPATTIEPPAATFPQMAPPSDLDATAISTLQQHLNTLGITYRHNQALPITGTYDATTRMAVMDFQQAQGLLGTGLADPATRALIEARAMIAELQQSASMHSTLTREPSLLGALVHAPSTPLVTAQSQPVPSAEVTPPHRVAHASHPPHGMGHQPSASHIQPEPVAPRVDQDAVSNQEAVLAIQTQLHEMQRQMDAMNQQREQEREKKRDGEKERAHNLPHGPAPHDARRPHEARSEEPPSRTAEPMSYSNPNHPQHALYARLKELLPSGTTEERLEQSAAACYMGRVARPGQLHQIHILDDAVHFLTTRPDAYASIDLNQPAPAVQQTMQQVQAYDQQQAQMWVQFEAQQREINARGGPTLRGPMMH